MKRLIAFIVGLLVVAAALFAYYRSRGVVQPPTLQTAVVTRGNVVETVEATGTLQAVTTVQVGTQVSGTIKALHADFNSQVRRGQVIAELDQSLFTTQVEQARATVARLEADADRTRVELEDAQVKLRRARELSAMQLISASELDAAEVNEKAAGAQLKSALAQIVQARASLNQAQVNLAHTVIAAPIDGIVISRNVDVGQTVAASMQAPTLFVLARDLTRMQVNASISESDIGRIEPGQAATFRVDAYPNRTFTGTVSQVRLDPVVQQNVVSYITVVDVANQDLKLKPGMTASVTVEIERAEGVLRVPNAALRVRPSADVLAAIGDPSAAGQTPARGHGEVWLAVAGRLRGVPVEPGISDGVTTAVRGGDLQEGADVVTAIAGQAPASATSSPLLPFGGRTRGAGGGAGRNPGGAR